MYKPTKSYRVRLSKRRSKTTKSAMNSKLVVRHRELTEDEIYAQVIYYIYCLTIHVISAQVQQRAITHREVALKVALPLGCWKFV